jgi:transposase
MQTITIVSDDKKERAPVEAGVTVKFGLDVHAAQITVCRQIDGQLPQPPQQKNWAECEEWIAAHVRAKAVVYSCYEAGPCGYGLHRRLSALGVTNYVVAPQQWDERGRRVKTDQRDARELCNRLDRYVRGNTTAFATVYVPSPEQERARALCRQRGAVLKERQRCVVRGHGLMLAQGVWADEGWWKPEAWKKLGPTLLPWLRTHIQWWQGEAVRLEQELAILTGQVEALAGEKPQPKGLGPLSAALIDQEILDWARFKNRRQIGSYTGLCPSEHSSGQTRKQGSISKCGNPRVRHQLIEAVWRLLHWQPEYPPLKKIRAATGARQRKRATVAVARRLAVDLWRIRTGRCSAEELGIKLVKD